MTPRDDVALALRLADEADALTMERFGALDLHVDTKPDLTPVTTRLPCTQSPPAPRRRMIQGAASATKAPMSTMMITNSNTQTW